MKMIIVFPVILSELFYSANSYSKCTVNSVLQQYSEFSASLRGRLIYHSYLSFGDGSSNLFLKDFRSNTLVQLNQKFWNIEDPVNAHFSPNGRYLTFMGKQNARWNIFIWKVGSLLAPINLSNNTPSKDGRSEDPKFSSNGNYIVYKNNNDIALIHLKFTNPDVPSVDGFWKITNNAYSIEESMPFLSADGNSVYYSQGVGETSDIYRINFKINYNTLNADKTTLVAGKSGVAEYYPVVQNKSLFFVGWDNYFSKNDQIYLVSNALYGQYKPIELSLNACYSNNSDPAIADNSHIIFSSTREDKFYNLYIGNIYTGKVWSLEQFGVNREFKHHLGASYTNAR